MSDAEVVADGVGGMIYDVLCYGTISMDNITRLDHLPTPRREAVAAFEYNAFGGEALQVAISLATWGCGSWS